MHQESNNFSAHFILVVDDDPLQRREIIRCMGDHGFSTLEAENGIVALNVVRREKPAIIIMDIKMPELDGVDTVKKLSENGDLAYGPKIILMTGDPDSLYRANRMGLSNVFGVIDKPLPLRVLSQFVHDAYKRFT